MSKIRIVTDSSITIEPELVEKYNITVVPLSVMVDGVIYSDSDLREEGRFLDMMKHSKELPKTSQPPVGLFAETYEKLVKEGVRNRLWLFTSCTHSLGHVKPHVKELAFQEQM